MDTQPTPQPVSPQPQAVDQSIIRNKNKLKLVWGLVCLIGPTALIILSLVIFAIVSFVTSSLSPAPSTTGDELFAPQSPAQTVGNILLFLVGAISILTWLPGIIVGIILLATRKPVPPQSVTID